MRVGDCLELLATAAERVPPTGPLFYQLLRAHGDLGPDAPAAIEVFSGRGQPGCEQRIDRFRIACRPVRDVLVDYLRERQPAVDFSTLQRLAYLLGKLFWARSGPGPARTGRQGVTAFPVSWSGAGSMPAWTRTR